MIETARSKRSPVVGTENTLNEASAGGQLASRQNLRHLSRFGSFGQT